MWQQQQLQQCTAEAPCISNMQHRQPAAACSSRKCEQQHVRAAAAGGEVEAARGIDTCNGMHAAYPCICSCAATHAYHDAVWCAANALRMRCECTALIRPIVTSLSAVAAQRAPCSLQCFEGRAPAEGPHYQGPSASAAAGHCSIMAAMPLIPEATSPPPRRRP